MNNKILVAGATGNLGGKIINALVAKKANVYAIVRMETKAEKIKYLESKGVKVFQINMSDAKEIARVCEGVTCIVSALAGLHETIIDGQKILLDGAILAKVPRFIPSDYSNDFTNLIEGENRNLDLRRDFHKYLDKQPIIATTIFNGPFMDLLVTDMPLILFKQKRILSWGKPDQIIEFTTTFNIAEFTANVALDDETPRFLRIAGDRLNCNQFVNLLTELTGKKYKLFRPGGIGLLNFLVKFIRFMTPKSNELYPAWQGMQYMRDMMEGRIIFQKYDNDRYQNMKWTSVKEFLIDEKVTLK
jgi:NmrA-like family